MAKELWVEKYRPSTVKDYVFKDNTQRKQVQNWINDGGIPHLLFSGSPGTGKTTIAKVLINELSIEDADVLYINASRDNGVEMIRKKITAFSETMPWGDFKVILLDEADHISPEGQAALRGVMEQYHASVRFILTCNYPNMIIPALHSRPDLRKTINTVQMSIADNLLQKPVDDSGASAVWRMDMIDLFKTGNIKAARELIVSKARTDEYNEIYTWLYRNLDLYTKTDAQYDDCVLAIRNGLVKHTQVADVEINLSATMIDLARAL